jgi:hypothetical protein
MKESLFLKLLDLASRGLTDEEIALLLDLVPQQVRDFFMSMSREIPFESMYPLVPNIDDWIDNRVRELRRAGIEWEGISKISGVPLSELSEKYLDDGVRDQRRKKKKQVAKTLPKKTTKKRSLPSLKGMSVTVSGGKIRIINKEEDS